MNYFKKKLFNEINNYIRCFCFKIFIVYLMDMVCSIYLIEYVWVFFCSKDIYMYVFYYYMMLKISEVIFFCKYK